MVEIVEKRRETKVKKEKDLRQELKEFRRVVRRDRIQYYNICKYIKDGNRHGKSKKIFQKISVLRRKFHPQIGRIKDANEQIITYSKIK